MCKKYNQLRGRNVADVLGHSLKKFTKFTYRNYLEEIRV